MDDPQPQILQSTILRLRSKLTTQAGAFAITLSGAVIGSLLVLAPIAPGIASAATVLTSTTGNVSAGKANLAQDDTLTSSQRIDLEGNATASLMVGDTAIVRLCHGASLGFANDRGGSPSALNLRNGQLKVSAGKRAVDDPLEIHTPAAIATLLGTEVHLDVDPMTGDTVVTSLDHDVRVNGVGAFASRAVVVSAGQSVTVRKDSGPGAVETADVPSITFSSPCLDDARYRIAAVKTARNKYGEDSLSKIALMDMEDGEDIPVVSAGPPIIPTGTLGPPIAAVVQPCLSYEQCVQGAGLNFVPSDPGPGPGGPGTPSPGPGGPFIPNGPAPGPGGP